MLAEKHSKRKSAIPERVYFLIFFIFDYCKVNQNIKMTKFEL